MLAQLFGGLACLAVEGLCVAGVFVFAFEVLLCVAAGFDVASFD